MKTRTLWILIGAALAVYLLAGCSASWHINTACRKQPSYCDTTAAPPDTVLIPGDSVYLPADSIYVPGRDTVIYKTSGKALLRITYRNGLIAGVSCSALPNSLIVQPRTDIKYVRLKPTFIQYIGAAGVGALVLALALLGFAISFKIKI